MIPQEWIKQNERELTAEEVKKLPPGARVTIIGADRYGECVRLDCTVVYSGKQKVLAYMDRRSWSRETMSIRELTNKKYTIARDAV